jgi:hypothetical protein
MEMVALQKPERMGWSSYHSALSVALVLAALFLFGQLNRNLLGTLSDYLTPILALVALAMAVLNVAKVGVRRNDRLSLVWFSFMLTLLFWLLAEVAWSTYPLVLGIPTPYPSISDVFGFVGYVPVMFGLLVQVWPFKEAFGSKKLGGMLLLVLVSSAVLIAVLPLIIYQMPLPALVVGLAYPILDVISLAIAIPALVIFMKGTFWRPFMFLAIGLILGLVAHVISGMTALNGTYYSGHPVELIFDWGYLSAALGFYLRRKQFLAKSL